jgi:predicted phage baseplate assembly protein
VLAGTAVRPGKAEIALDDLRPSAVLTGPVRPLQLQTRSRVLLRDALGLGADLAANVADDGAGDGTVTPLGTAMLPAPLRTPVAAFGNLVAVSRGESAAEVLGSGDATRTFQTFRLKKKPLTYLASPGSETGRQSTLQVWVDAVLWREVPSLFLAGPDDRVYTVRQTVDGETEISFGGGGFGQPLPSGVDNVRAVYRFGGGAASPPAGALRQFARPIKGIRRVINPLAAFGGDDGDQPEDIRTAAPNSALSLGRAISLLDFEAIARGYRGILNAAATWSWDTREQRAAVKLWVVPPTDDGGEQLRADLEAHLVANAAPGTPIAVGLAVAVPATLDVEFTVASDRDRAVVGAELLAVLADDETGLLSRRRVPIGAPLFRADILAAVRAVDGVEDVRGLFVDAASAPFALNVAEGAYLDVTLVQAE